MSEESSQFEYAERLLSGLFNQDDAEGTHSDDPVSAVADLRALFEQQKDKLNQSQRSVQTELAIEYRALNGMLDGTQKMVDLLALARVANFLGLSFEQVALLLLKKLEKNFIPNIETANKQEFIAKNFDLPKLKKCGLIDSVSDFDHIEKVIVDYFDLNSIYDYGKEFISVAFSSGKPKPGNQLMRTFWCESATGKLKRINNPNRYDRAGLIEYIPSIRWHSTDIKNGLFQVVRELYKLGVTVIYEPYLTTLYVRGATFPIDQKPCIALTNYTNYYPSLWFSLIHELHHVLFDWEEIRRNNKPHVSDEIDRFDKKEVDADTFAREYLFSEEKMKVVSSQIGNETFVRRYAQAFDVHPSLIYGLYCFDNLATDQDVFKKYKKYLEGAQQALVALDPDAMIKSPLQKRTSIRDKFKQIKKGLFNGL